MRTRTDLHIPGTDVRIGDRARDEISGFEGIVTGHSRHLTGCDGAWLMSEDPKVAKEDRERYFDILRLELVERNPKNIQALPADVPAAG